MEHVTMILTPLEMLFVNLFVIHQCSQRKYSQMKTLVGMGLFVCVLSYIAFSLSSQAPDFGSGNGLFIFSGLLFIIPVKLFYRAPGVKIVTITCFSWTYTFMLFALSVRLGYALNGLGWNLNASVLLLQTILYIVTFRAFYSMLKSKFVYILEHIGKREAVALMWMGIIWFGTLIVINLALLYPGIGLLQIVTFLTLTICILISFQYTYLQVNSNNTIQTLEKIVYRDELTQLRTRVILDQDAENFISRNMPFHLIFFDLDKFKSINDRYGHLVGDKYLAFFAYEIKKRVGNRGGFYRVAGDEFVCILPEKGLVEFIEAIKTLPDKMPDTQVKFLGFSYGVATYPQNGGTIERLLEYADKQMYAMKCAEPSLVKSEKIIARRVT